MTAVAKLNDKFVRLVKTQETVAFSQEKNWVLGEYDLATSENRRQFRRWLPLATTRFTWVREFTFQIDS